MTQYKTLYNDDSMAPSFPRNILVKLMQLATSSVKFSFNNNMHRQIDGVAMGSPFGPALANIFVGYQEAKLFNIAKRPLVYFWYVDDTFAVFNNKEDCNTFFIHLNSLHSSLRGLEQKRIYNLTRQGLHKDENNIKEVLELIHEMSLADKFNPPHFCYSRFSFFFYGYHQY